MNYRDSLTSCGFDIFIWRALVLLLISTALTNKQGGYDMWTKFTSLKPVAIIAIVVAITSFTVAPAEAEHSWLNLHWERADTNEPVALEFGDNVSSAWDTYLDTAITDWVTSSVLDLSIEAGGTNPQQCSATSGRIEVCNGEYGTTDWVGLATVWSSRDHITEATILLNDTWFNTPEWDTAEWRQLVMCQEIGHMFGLAHVDENFENTNLGTCMDYTNDASTNQHPNDHDFEQLETIYDHGDEDSSGRRGRRGRNGIRVPGDEAAEWGQAIRFASDGKPSVYVRHLGGDNHVYTFVIWAE